MTIKSLSETITVTRADNSTKTIKGYLNFWSEMRLISHMIYKGGNNQELKRFTVGLNEGQSPIQPTFLIAKTIHNWVRDNIKYTPDVSGLESLQEPLITLKNRFGDCDDMVILLCSMLKSIGFDVGVVGVNAGGEDFNHVYSVIRTDNGWIFSDTTGSNNPLGFEIQPELYTKKHIVFID